MSDTTWVALLRGINVGGRNRLAMADLRSTLTEHGLANVRTYIQSGNVLFDVDEPVDGEGAIAAMATSMSAAIARTAGRPVPVVLRSLDEVAQLVAGHPGAGGTIPDKWLHVLMLDRAATADAAPDPARFAPDRYWVDGRNVYAAYPNGSGRSKLTIDVFERSFAATGTARNLASLRAIVALGGADR